MIFMNKKKKLKEIDFVDRWAHYVKDNPTTWKKQHTAFINAIFDKHQAWRKKILAKPNGKQIIAELYGIKNQKVLDSLK